LSVHPDRMRANIDRTSGAIFAERVMMLATPSMGKELAQRLVAEALAHARETGKGFREALMAMPDAARVIPPDTLRTIDVPEDYLGVAETLRKQLLGQVNLPPL
jgi:adenylosuccinate lyase